MGTEPEDWETIYKLYNYVPEDEEVSYYISIKEGDYLRQHRTIRRRVWHCLFRHLRHADSSIFLQ